MKSIIILSINNVDIGCNISKLRVDIYSEICVGARKILYIDEIELHSKM